MSCFWLNMFVSIVAVAGNRADQPSFASAAGGCTAQRHRVLLFRIQWIQVHQGPMKGTFWNKGNNGIFPLFHPVRKEVSVLDEVFLSSVMHSGCMIELCRETCTEDVVAMQSVFTYSRHLLATSSAKRQMLQAQVHTDCSCFTRLLT